MLSFRLLWSRHDGVSVDWLRQISILARRLKKHVHENLSEETAVCLRDGCWNASAHIMLRVQTGATKCRYCSDCRTSVPQDAV